MKQIAYRGHKYLGHLVIKALEDMGGENIDRHSGLDEEGYYFLDKNNIIRWAAQDHYKWFCEQVFTIMDISLVEGDYYWVSHGELQNCLFIYKNTNTCSTSFLCGINADGIFTTDKLGAFGPIKNVCLASPKQIQLLNERIAQEGYTYNKDDVTLSQTVKWSAEKNDAILVRDSDHTTWHLRSFQGHVISSPSPFKSQCARWKYAVPYNDETKHWIGRIMMNTKYEFMPK